MVIRSTQWITAIVLALLIVCSAQQPTPVFAAETQNNVPYTKWSWDGTKVVDTTEYAGNVTIVPADGSMTEGWYYLNSDVTVKHRISLTGDTNLILGNDVTLDVKGIYIPQGSTFSSNRPLFTLFSL